MTAITGVLRDASGAAVVDKRITAKLVASSTLVLTPAGEIIERASTTSASDGSWSLTLTPVSTLAYPDGAYYRIVVDGFRWDVTVPDSGTYDVAAVLVTDPPAQPDLGLTPTVADARYLRQSENLDDLDDPTIARTNLGLGTAATRDVGTSSGQVAAGDAPAAAVTAHVAASDPHGDRAYAAGIVGTEAGLRASGDSAAVASAAADATSKANAAQAAAVQRANHTGTQLASTVSDFDTQVRTSRLDQMATPTGSVALGSQKITGLANGSAATDAAAVGQAALRTNDLSDLASASTARTNLGLGTSATKTAVDVREYTSSQAGISTPAGILGAWVTLIGGGGGGGSGRRGAAGTVRCGGGGGGGGGIHSNVWVPAAAFGAAYSITIGAGGSGGAARTANDTDGANGGAGAATSATTGTLTLITPATGAAGGGSATAGTSGGGGFPAGGNGGAASGTGLAGGSSAGVTGTIVGTVGGGAGGGVTSGDSPNNGGAGSGLTYYSLGVGTGGVVGGSSPAAGGTTGIGTPASGSGGGAASITAAAQAGAAGGAYGSGGGGGGASLNGNNSGAGGTGGPGFARLTFVY